MAPVKEVHLNLAEVPVILLLMVEQPVKITDVTMIGESQVLDTTCLTLLHQEIEDAVIEETTLERIHASTNAMQQVVVDMVDLQALH